ncbi:hypothetical protein [Burkholderia latens]|uniref:hypothetical protein n=1 Tax=Burkholderia latens TaxID=488446 RepID=UPI001AE25E68|nr:hypothetical protein [Burkholderia latens]QTO42168.1 hypothetical protein J8I85_08655 [Burkholderia latens]
MSKNDEETVSGGLVVSHRPQISVELNHQGEIVISTASIADSFESVDIDHVRFPIECVREIADALYRLVDAHS